MAPDCNGVTSHFGAGGGGGMQYSKPIASGYEKRDTLKRATVHFTFFFFISSVWRLPVSKCSKNYSNSQISYNII